MPFATPYESINSGCSSFILPFGCSGLAVLSKHPIIEVKTISEDQSSPAPADLCPLIFQVRLVPFTHRGNFWKFDGEIFVRKGVGIARILWYEKTIDVFTTHLVSYGSKVKDNDRIIQLKLTDS